jgi:hypothetical protein
MESGISLGLFSKIQVDIFKTSIHGASNASVCEIYKLCNSEAIARCLIRSVLGFYWNRICHGGRLPYPSYLRPLTEPDGIIATERESPTFSLNIKHYSHVIAVLSGTRMRRNYTR